MKAYGENGVRNPRIFNVGTKWMSVVNSPAALYQWEEYLRCKMLDVMAKRKLYPRK
jgi:hypothetical protein